MIRQSPVRARKVGWGLAALVVAGNMIGSGVYLLPVTLASIGSSSLIGWGVCGLGALTLALVFAGLGRFHPDADGLADYATRGLGRFIGYQTALFFWMACLIGNVAVAVAATGYLAFFLPILREPTWGAVSNLAVIWLATGAYVVSARTAARLGGVLLVLGLVPIVLGILAGVVAFSPDTFTGSWSPDGSPLAQSVPASLVLIFWAFLGVESAAAMSGLVKDPARDVGRATVVGVVGAFAIYVAASVAIFGVIPAMELATSTSPYADLTGRVFGASLGGLVAVCAVLKATGTVTGWTMLGGEQARAAAERGFLPRWFGRDGRRPLSNPLINALLMSALVVATVQPSLGGQFGILIGAVSVMSLTIYGVCAIALLRATRRVLWRGVAAAGLVFALGAAAAAAPGYLMPAATLFAMASVGWLWARKGRPTVIDPPASPL